MNSGKKIYYVSNGKSRFLQDKNIAKNVVFQMFVSFDHFWRGYLRVSLALPAEALIPGLLCWISFGFSFQFGRFFFESSSFLFLHCLSKPARYNPTLKYSPLSFVIRLWSRKCPFSCSFHAVGRELFMDLLSVSTFCQRSSVFHMSSSAEAALLLEFKRQPYA